MKFLSYVSKLEKENRLFAGIVLLLILVVLVEGFLLYKASVHKVVLVLPPRVDREFWVSGDELSKAYLEQVGYFVSDRLLNVSSANVESSISAIYPFLTTNINEVKAIKEFFANYINTIKGQDIVQSFHPLKVVITENSVSVEGILHKVSGNVYIGNERKILTLFYEVKNGRFMIKEVKF